MVAGFPKHCPVRSLHLASPPVKGGEYVFKRFARTSLTKILMGGAEMDNDTIRSAAALVNRVINSPELTQRVKDDPTAELPKIADQIIREMQTPLKWDMWIYRLVVISLGSTIIIVVGGAVYLAATKTGDVKIPEVLTAIGSAAVGALAGLLAPSPASK
jgi:hypothetical protein